MKILAIGPGESTQWLFQENNFDIPNDVVLLGMHRVFPHIKTKLNYWTWGDPDAAVEGLDVYSKSKNLNELPTIILPSYFENVSTFNKNAGTSPINSSTNRKHFYNNTLKVLIEKKKVILLKNSLNTKTLPKNHEVFINPSLRFSKDNIYFGTVPFDGVNSESRWAKENKFTSLILPICYHLKATEVYCIGFDNQGTGIKRSIPQSYNNPSVIKEYLSKYPKWVKEWKKHHKMKIYSIAPDRFTLNNTIMEYKSIKELKWIK